MQLGSSITAYRVEDPQGRSRALEVLHEVYRGEKAWTSDPESLFPTSDLDHDQISWFVAERRGQPVGVTRVLYAIPVELYEAYEFQLADGGLDVQAFVRDNRIAEIGRFAVRRRYRRQILVAAALIRAAATDTVRRGFTHYITDIFEGDPNSPYDFHRRVMGFQVVATHDHGELRHDGRRVTMLLDIGAAYRRLLASRNWIFRYITRNWGERELAQLDLVTTKIA